MLILSNPPLFCILSLQMQQWFNVEGERHLMEAESVEDSGDRMEQILNSFTGFLIDANVSLCYFSSFCFAAVCLCFSVWVSLSVQDRRHHAMTLVSEAERLQQSGLSYPESEVFGSLVCTFKSGLEDFLCRAEACGRELQIMVNVCDFCEQVGLKSTFKIQVIKTSMQLVLLSCRNACLARFEAKIQSLWLFIQL